MSRRTTAVACLAGAVLFASSGVATASDESLKEQISPRGTASIQPSPEKPSVTKQAPSSVEKSRLLNEFNNQAASQAAGIPRFAAKLPTLVGATEVVSRTDKVSAAAVVSVPTLTSPAGGATVAGNVSVSATSSADEVRFTFSAGSSTDPVLAETTTPVVGGVATTSVPSWGLQGSVTLAAYDCVAGECGAAAQRSLVVNNPAPVLTSPTDGLDVTGPSFTAAATAGGGALAFLIDGSITGLDNTDPYSVLIASSAIGTGTHTVSAVQCNTGLTACNWTDISNTATIQVRYLTPMMSEILPGVISPNGDGRSDSARVTFRLDRRQNVVLRVKNAAGATIRGPLNFGALNAGVHGWTWNGLTQSGARAANGRYTVSITTSALISGVTTTGSAARTVRVDTTPPRVSGVSATLTTFYPYKDGYRDYTWLKGSTSEATRFVTAQVFNSNNRLVRSMTLNYQQAGAFAISWNGRNNSGTPQPAGRYTFRFVARDSAGNQFVTGRTALNLSAKRLRPVSFTTTMSAYAAFDSMASGTYWDSPYVDGGQLLWGDPIFGDWDLGTYSWPLPSSLAGYSSVRLEVCSGRSAYSDPLAGFGYINPVNYDGLYNFTQLGDAGNTCYGSSGYAPSQAFYGRTLGWTVGNTDEFELSYWEVAGFRITGKRYVLG